MEAVLLVIHLVLALGIIGLVLLQRSEGGGLGIGGGGGMGALASARTAASALSRMTAILAAGFFVTSLLLGILAGRHGQAGSIMEALDQAPSAPVKAGAEAGKHIPRPPPPEPSAPVSD